MLPFVVGVSPARTVKIIGRGGFAVPAGIPNQLLNISAIRIIGFQVIGKSVAFSCGESADIADSDAYICLCSDSTAIGVKNLTIFSVGLG